MQIRTWAVVLALGVMTAGAACLAVAQGPPPAAQGAGPGGGRGGRGGGGGGAPAYPTRPAVDPAIVQTGRQLFSANCAFCHGADATGGEGGPNLIVSELVLDDQHGELIGQVLQTGRPDKGMPKFDLGAAEVTAIAEFVHSFPTRGGFGGGVPVKPANPVVGDAKAGEAFFNGAGKCNTCHSATGDLAGIGAKYDPRTLQGAILTGGAGGGRGGPPANVPPTTVTVTTASGQKVEGKLGRIDFFYVSLTDANGDFRSFTRDGDSPKVEVHDPLKAHKDKLPTYKDDDIHNLTAYLVTLK